MEDSHIVFAMGQNTDNLKRAGLKGDPAFPLAPGKFFANSIADYRLTTAKGRYYRPFESFYATENA